MWTKYKINNAETFVNPYNFVEIDFKNGTRNQKKTNQEGERVTGCFHCKLKAKTPIAIPDVERKKMNGKHPTYPFMRQNGKAIIPGSSIRGCIRSLFETVTDSCFVTMDDKAYLSNRTEAREYFSPALLIWNEQKKEWQLYKAKRNSVPVKHSKFKCIIDDNKERCISYQGKKYHMGDKVSFELDELGVCFMESVPESTVDSAKVGYLFVGEPIGSKKNESIFSKGDLIEIYTKEEINKAINGLILSVEMYQDSGINKNYGEGHTGYRSFNRLYRNKQVIPVWYNQKNQKVLTLSMAAIGRRVFTKTINEMIGSTYSPCRTRKEACPACQLFGMAKGESIGSRVRITDGILQQGNITKKRISLKELGSPRTGYYPFYELHGLNFDADGASISGRKYYWHDMRAASDRTIYQDETLTLRNASMELAETGSEFLFDVYFDSITKAEYEELKWTLTLGENNETGEECHKIGHGKPIGLGSAKITIQSEEIRSLKDNVYQVMENKEVSVQKNLALLNQNVVQQVLKISNFTILKGLNVTYPYIGTGAKKNRDPDDESLAAYNWFAQNKAQNKARNKAQDKTVQTRSLPSIKTQSQNLPVYEVDNNFRRNNRGKSSQKKYNY